MSSLRVVSYLLPVTGSAKLWRPAREWGGSFWHMFIAICCGLSLALNVLKASRVRAYRKCVVSMIAGLLTPMQLLLPEEPGIRSLLFNSAVHHVDAELPSAEYRFVYLNFEWTLLRWILAVNTTMSTLRCARRATKERDRPPWAWLCTCCDVPRSHRV